MWVLMGGLGGGGVWGWVKKTSTSRHPGPGPLKQPSPPPPPRPGTVQLPTGDVTDSVPRPGQRLPPSLPSL